MATKNFSSMSTKKLNTLLETTSDEDKVKIQEVLDNRANVSAPVGGIDTDEVIVEPLTEEEKAIAKDLESKKETKAKMTDEERTELANELRATHINHRCEVVPFNTAEWVSGVIVGIIEDKRANKVMFTIKTDDGRRIVKACTSNLVKVLDEVVEPVRKVRSNKKTQLDENGNPIGNIAVEEWTDEAIEEAVKTVIDNVGKKISYPKTGALGVELEGQTETGRIVSLVPNKRQHTILYRIEIDGEDKKYAHKVSSNSSLVINDELDEQGAKIQDAFKNRRYKEVVKKVAVSPEDAFKSAEAALNKTKEQFEKIKNLLAKREEAYNKAKEAYEASIKEEDLA